MIDCWLFNVQRQNISCMNQKRIKYTEMREGGTKGASTFDCHWKSMESWEETKHVTGYNNMCTMIPVFFEIYKIVLSITLNMNKTKIPFSHYT